MLSPWSEIGTSAMSGGAFNWGNIWSGIKSFGSSLKNFGVKTWNSSAAQALKDKLKDTKVQEKIIDGINAGVHGALDIARQELERKVAAKLDRPKPIPEIEPPEIPEETIVPIPQKTTMTEIPKKRPLNEEELIITTDEPPSYDSLYANKSPAPPLVATPVISTRPSTSLITPPLTAPSAGITTLEESIPLGPLRKPTTFVRPARNNWQSTLNSIVGLGVRSVKRRRCY